MDPKIDKAVATGDMNYLENLSESDWNEYGQMRSHIGNTILHIAVEYRKWFTAKLIIEKCKSLLHERNFNGDSPLHLAVRRRRSISWVRLLIQDVKERKKLVRIVNLKGDTALHEAVRTNNLEAVELLMSENEELACLNNNEGESPVFIAVDKSFYRIARHILKTAPTCSFAGRNGMNVIHAVVIRSKQSLFYTILHPFCQFMLFTSALITILFPLWSIVSFLSLWCLKQLNYFKFTTIGSDFISEVYERDSSVISQSDQFGWIPLHYAAYVGNIHVVNLLLKLDNSDTLLILKENEGMSALHIAAKGNQAFVVDKLTCKYPYIKEYVDNKGRTAFHVAAEDGKTHVVEFFIRKLAFDGLLN